MLPKATCLIPSYNNGKILRWAILSVLQQTVEDLELFIVGDGISEEGRAVAKEFQKSDSRVKFFDNPKGERHGEVHRNRALKEARGQIYCYQSDDDLWLPCHLEHMLELLGEYEFANSLPITISEEGNVDLHLGSLAYEKYRDFFRAGMNFIPLNCMGHTKALYERLPEGWRPGPKKIYSDLNMYQQITDLEDLKAVSGIRPTAIHFPSPDRKTWSKKERYKELEEWFGRLNDSWLESYLQTEAIKVAMRKGLAERLRLAKLKNHCKKIETENMELRERLSELTKPS